MKKSVLLFLSLFLIISVKAQLINVNPDPNGEPWYIGNFRTLTQEELSSIRTIENIKYQNTKDLPSSLDNSENQFFRPIFNQQGGSCAQASGIAYNFTYEMCRERNLNASLETNQYPSHFTYTFLNRGSGENGSTYTDGWSIIRKAGCPNVADYGGIWMDDDYESNHWASGYDIYENGLENRVDDYFSIDVSTADGLNTLKHWMYDHLEDETTGGIVNFSAGISVGNYNINNDYIITSWGMPVNHAMTIVGWDDDIEYDFNGDNQITTTIDINGDNIVDMRDWERGAVIMVNSWGYYWGNMGKAYIPYRLLAESLENGGINSNKVFSLTVKETYEPLLVLKTKISHQSRNKIAIKAGVSTDLSATEPEIYIDFPIFNFQGGDLPMNGNNSTALELALDITSLLSYFDSDQEVKLFLGVIENDSYSFYSGQIEEFSIKNVQTNDEAICESSNVTIQNNTTTWISVNTSINFDAPLITTEAFNLAFDNEEFSQQLEASGGEAPYKFNLIINYEEVSTTTSFPQITSDVLTPSSDDDGIAEINLAFDFPFYGQNYNTLYVSTDGSILFSPDFSYLRTKEAIKSEKMIAVYATDLMYFAEDNDAIYFESNSDYAIVRWKASVFENQDANIDVAAKIHSNGDIEFFYGCNITDDISWEAGISSGDKSNYLLYSESGIGNPENSSFKFAQEDFPTGYSLSEDGLFHGFHEVAGSWTLNVMVTDSRDISKSKLMNFVIAPTSISEINDNNFVKCYPNPAKGIINFDFVTNEIQDVTLEIFNLNGSKIETITKSNLSRGENSITINNLSNYNSGIYFYKLNLKNKTYSGKFIKE